MKSGTKRDNHPLPCDRHWTRSRLLRAVVAFVCDSFLPKTVLGHTGRRETHNRLTVIVAAIMGADPEITPKEICTWLEAIPERTPCGRTSWHPSSLKMLLKRVERLGSFGYSSG